MRKDVPVFLKQTRSGEEHVFVRSDWIIQFLCEHLAPLDARRVSTMMHASRVLSERGPDAAKEFLAAFGVPEH